MIDEAVLHSLLRDEAEAVPVPEGGMAKLVEMLTTQTRQQHHNRRHLTYVAAVAAGVVGLAFALGPAINSSRSFNSESGAPSALTLDARDDSAASETTGAADSLETEGAAGSGRVVTTARHFALDAAAARAEQAKVVRNGSVELEVNRGRLGQTVQRLSALAVTANGYLAKQESIEHGDAPSAILVIRVPSSTFARTLSRVRELGTVLSATTLGTDVSAQYTDLGARQRSLESARAQLLTVMESAQTTGEVLAVLDRVTEVQTQLEQIQGETKSLDDRTAYGSLTVSISEKASEAEAAAADPRTGLALAFDQAKGGFARRSTWLVAHSGSGIVLFACGLAALLILRLVWLRLRRGWL